MDSQSIPGKLESTFERVRPVIERCLESMQSSDRQKVSDLWQELVSMIETENYSIEMFAEKLSDFSRQIHEYIGRSRMLSSNEKMTTI